MKELMIHVEKAVRPLRASPRQKLKIREELFAHLQGIYDEEFARLQDQGSAVHAAIERFGPTDELSEKLRASLPWYSFIVSLLLQRISRDLTRPDSLLESTLWGWRLGIAFMVFIGAPWYLILILSGRLLVGEAVWLWVLLTLYGFALLWPWVGLLGYATSARRTIFFGIALWCGIMTLPVLFWSVPWFGPKIADAWFGNDTKLLVFAVFALLIPVITVFISRTKGFARLLQADLERGARSRKWELLDLG